MDQAERGELGTLKNVLTRHFRFSRPDCLVHPSPVPPPNQIKTQCSSLSIATIMSMSVSNLYGSGTSNRGASPALGYDYGSWVMRCNPEGCIATQTHTHTHTHAHTHTHTQSLRSLLLSAQWIMGTTHYYMKILCKNMYGQQPIKTKAFKQKTKTKI